MCYCCSLRRLWDLRCMMYDCGPCTCLCLRGGQSSRVPYHQSADQAEGRLQLVAAQQWTSDWHQGGETMVNKTCLNKALAHVAWVSFHWTKPSSCTPLQDSRSKELPSEWSPNGEQPSVFNIKIHSTSHQAWVRKVNTARSDFYLKNTSLKNHRCAEDKSLSIFFLCRTPTSGFMIR